MPGNPAHRDEQLRGRAELTLAMQIGAYVTGQDKGQICDYTLLKNAGRRVPSQCNGCDGARGTCSLNILNKPKRVN